MATDIDQTRTGHGPAPSPGLKARADPPPQPLTDALRLAIDGYGLSLKTLERASGVCSSLIGEFLRGKRLIILETADRLAAGVGLAAAKRGAGVGDGPPARRFSDPLLSAIDGCGLSPYKIARAAGIPEGTVSSFLRRGRSMYLEAADKLCITLDLEVIRLARVEAPPRAKPSDQPFEKALRTSFDASGLTINALERASRVNQGSIGRFLRRRATISIKTADRLACVLGVEVPGNGAGPGTQPFSAALRSSISGSGISRTALVEASGVDFSTIRRFLREEILITIETADRLACVLGLKAVVKSVDRNLGRPVLDIDDARTSLESLRSAIDRCGLSVSEICRRSGVDRSSIRNLLDRRGRPHYLTVAKLFAALGLDPVTATLQPQSAEVSSPAGLRPVLTWPPRRWPVSFGADGSPIAGQSKTVTDPQLKVIRALVDAGPAGLTGNQLLTESGQPGYRRILATLARDEDWRSRIRWAGDSHGHYRLAMPGDK